MSANKPPFDGECKRVKLNDIAVVKAGNVAPKKDDFSKIGTPFVRAGSLTSLLAGGMLSDLELIDEPTAQKLRMTLFPEGTVVFAKSGMSCMTGNVYVLPEPCYVVSHLACVIPVGDYAVYLKHYFRSNRPSKLVENPSFPSIRLSKIQNMELEIPVRSEMEKQVRSLEHIESLIEWSKEQIAMLDTLVKSRFVEIFGGLNSTDLRPLKDVCSIITDGTHQPPKFVDRGIPFLFVSNITSDAIDYETNKFISVEDYEQLIRRTPIEVGDVLVSAVGSFGHPAIVEDDRPFCFQRHIAYLKPRHDLIDSSYLHAALLSEGSQRYMDRCAKGAAQRTVTLKSFKEMKVPLPPLALQQEFASFVAEVDKSRFIVKQKIEKLQMLYDSLAQEYFG